jgi:VanZ family protein
LNPVIQPELRLKRLWLAIGAAMVLVILLGCLLPSHDLPKIGVSDKLEHFLGFGGLAFWFGSIVVRADLPWVGFAVVAFGGLIEIVQGMTGRDAEWLDWAADSVGVAIGMALVFTPLGQWARWFEARVQKARQ